MKGAHALLGGLRAAAACLSLFACSGTCAACTAWRHANQVHAVCRARDAGCQPARATPSPQIVSDYFVPGQFGGGDTEMAELLRNMNRPYAQYRYRMQFFRAQPQSG